MEDIKIKPIGIVEVSEGRYTVKIDKKFCDALICLEGFSHVNVVFWGHNSDSEKLREITTVEKPYKKGPDKIGVFATRSQFRPNPVLITPAKVISLDPETGTIELAYLDADNMSPLIDIKPYMPCIDRLKEFKYPEWCNEWPLWYEDSAEFDWSEVFNF